MRCPAARIEAPESSDEHFGGAVAAEKTIQSQSLPDHNAKQGSVRTTNV